MRKNQNSNFPTEYISSYLNLFTKNKNYRHVIAFHALSPCQHQPKSLCVFFFSLFVLTLSITMCTRRPRRSPERRKQNIFLSACLFRGGRGYGGWGAAAFTDSGAVLHVLPPVNHKGDVGMISYSRRVEVVCSRQDVKSAHDETTHTANEKYARHTDSCAGFLRHRRHRVSRARTHTFI